MCTVTTSADRDRRDDTARIDLLPFGDRHLRGALRLTSEMGWPHRLEDWAFAIRLGQGFVLEQDGDVIGTAAFFPHGPAHATAGLIIVSGEAQGRGLGARLMDALLEAARPRGIVLNSTPAGRSLYRRRGFEPVGLVHQHQGILPASRTGPPPDAVRPLEAADFEAIVRLDAEASGLDRRALLRGLREAGTGHVLLRNGSPAGYAVARPFGRGYVVGPVVAETPADARLLIEAALAPLAGRFVRFDTAAIGELGPWFEAIGLPRVGEATTMLLGSPPRTGPARVYALASQSLS